MSPEHSIYMAYCSTYIIYSIGWEEKIFFLHNFQNVDFKIFFLGTATMSTSRDVCVTQRTAVRFIAGSKILLGEVFLNKLC